jgi:hypothetical protein
VGPRQPCLAVGVQLALFRWAGLSAGRMKRGVLIDATIGCYINPGYRVRAMPSDRVSAGRSSGAC